MDCSAAHSKLIGSWPIITGTMKKSSQNGKSRPCARHTTKTCTSRPPDRPNDGRAGDGTSRKFDGTFSPTLDPTLEVNQSRSCHRPFRKPFSFAYESARQDPNAQGSIRKSTAASCALARTERVAAGSLRGASKIRR